MNNENFCNGLTDGRTDRGEYIGPEGGSKNILTHQLCDPPASSHHDPSVWILIDLRLIISGTHRQSDPSAHWSLDFL